MVRITDKDRVFVAVALPVAILALHLVFIHEPLTKRLSSLRSRYAALGTAAEIKADRPVLDARMKRAAAARIEAEEAESARIAAESGGNPAVADDSARFGRIMTMLGGSAGVRVVSAERLEGGEASGGRAKELVREAAGIGEPALWRFTANADFGSIMKVLGDIGKSGVPAIVDGVSFGGTAGRGNSKSWRMDIWL